MREPVDFLTIQERVAVAIASLPVVPKSEIPLKDSCPICLNTFDDIHEERVQAEGVLVGLSTTFKPVPLRGVTQLVGCGHYFCRVDLIEWIRGRHGTCPACRDQFANIRPPTDSDNESSDGDYDPGDEEDEEEDDGFLDTDGFEGDDLEFEVDEMDLDEELQAFVDGDVELEREAGIDWGDRGEDEGVENWGLSDGDGSESLSEGDLLVSGDDESVHGDSAEVFDVEAHLPEAGDITEEDK